MKPLYLIAEIFPHPEKLEDARQAYLELRAATLQEEGCVCYDLVSDGVAHWFMLEKWASKEAWDRHMETSHVARIRTLEPQITARQTKLNILTEVS